MGFWHRMLAYCRGKSPWLLHYDCGSCNGCDIEVAAALTPVYDAERFGAILVGTPRQADILLVSGTVNHRNRRVLAHLYGQMFAPKVVMAVGSCALSGGIFHDSYNVLQGADRVVPVAVYVPGCPPRPERILEGVLQSAGILGKGGQADGDPLVHTGATGPGTGEPPRGGPPLGRVDGSPGGE